jgi:hypothetical protein
MIDRPADIISLSSGRTHVIISGITVGTCCSMPALSMLNDGYQVFPVVDACGAWNDYESQAAMARMNRPAPNSSPPSAPTRRAITQSARRNRGIASGGPGCRSSCGLTPAR